MQNITNILKKINCFQKDIYALKREKLLEISDTWDFGIFNVGVAFTITVWALKINQTTQTSQTDDTL